MKLTKITCGLCKKKILATRSDTKFCSKKCGYKSYLLKNDRTEYYRTYWLKRKTDKDLVYKRRKRTWEWKYGDTYPYGPDNIAWKRRK